MLYFQTYQNRKKVINVKIILFKKIVTVRAVTERFDRVNRAQRNTDTSQPSTQSDSTESAPTN